MPEQARGLSSCAMPLIGGVGWSGLLRFRRLLNRNPPEPAPGVPGTPHDGGIDRAVDLSWASRRSLSLEQVDAADGSQRAGAKPRRSDRSQPVAVGLMVNDQAMRMADDPGKVLHTSNLPVRWLVNDQARFRTSPACAR